MSERPFVPGDFDPPTALRGEGFRLEPLGPQHNESDHAAWTSSIEHIRATPGYPDGRWPPLGGMTLEENLADLERHAADFTAKIGRAACRERIGNDVWSGQLTCRAGA